MGKMCSFSRHTNSLLSGIASLECKMVKNAKQCAASLFTGAEIFGKFPCKLCTIYWSNHPRAFVGLVQGELLSNFHIQQSMHFGFENWRKVESKRDKWNCVWIGRTRARRRPRAATSTSPYLGRARTPRHRWTQRSEALAVATVQLGTMTRAGSLGRSYAAGAHSPASEPPFPIGRRYAARRHRLRAHA
jgi:hypothetical protein